MPVWTARCRNQDPRCVSIRGCHKDAQPFFFLLRQPLSDVWWLPTNRHRLPTNRHRLHTNRYQLPTNRHRLHTNRHRLPTNRHRLPTNRHRLPTNRHRLHTNRHRLHTNRHRLHTNRHQLPTGRHHRAYWTLRVFFLFIMANPGFYGGHSTGYKLGNHPKNIEPCAHRATTPPKAPKQTKILLCFFNHLWWSGTVLHLLWISAEVMPADPISRLPDTRRGGGGIWERQWSRHNSGGLKSCPN